MPVLLTPDQFAPWLNGTMGPSGLKPAAESALREWVVSRRVNKACQDDDDPSLVERDEAA